MSNELFEKELNNLKTFFLKNFLPLDSKSSFSFEKNKKGKYDIKFQSQKEKRNIKNLECSKKSIFQVFSCFSETFPEVMGKDDL